MKTFYILTISFVIVFLFPNDSFSQQYNFAPIGATWYYKMQFINVFGGGYVKLVADRDTVIQGRRCTIILGTQYVSQSNFHEMDSIFILTQDSLKIQYYTRGSFTTIYDFGAAKMDSWAITEGSDTNFVTVLETDSVFIQNKRYKRLIVRYSNFIQNDTIVEKIGAFIYFIPIFNTKNINYTFEGLNCYSDSALIYKNNNIEKCETRYNFDIGIKETEPDISMATLYPNPFREYFFVKLQNSDNKPIVITIYDQLGKAIFHSVNYTNAKITVPKLQPGIYILRVHCGNNIYYNKLIKY